MYADSNPPEHISSILARVLDDLAAIVEEPDDTGEGVENENQ